MARSIVLGNQRLLINIDKWMQVRDIFFPYVGQYNHVQGHAHRIAVIEGNNISWINSDEWRREIAYRDETLVTNSKAHNAGMQLSLHFEENVYCEDDIFFRKITVTNHSPYKRRIRICFFHDFQMYSNKIGETAFYNIKCKSLIHYKYNTYFLIGITNNDGTAAMSDYSIGAHVDVGWHLNKNPVAQGEVYSVAAIDVDIMPSSSNSVTYYLLAGDDMKSVLLLQDNFLKKGVDTHLDHSTMCQRGWLGSTNADLSMFDKRIQDLYKRSLLIVKTQIDRNGAIIAANDTDNMQFNKDTYSYMWPRDGALVAIALIRAGFASMTPSFFKFCKDVLYEEGCLLHKYNPDRSLGSSWHPWVYDNRYSIPLQEDETALVLHALSIYYKSTKDIALIKELYEPLIKPAALFLARYRYPNNLPKESYDLWEERRGVFTFTTSAVIAGLRAGDFLGELVGDDTLCKTCEDEGASIREAMIKYLWDDNKGYFIRGVSFVGDKELYDRTLDASAYAAFEFGVFSADDKMITSTMDNIISSLWVKTPIGGIARYDNDYYHQVSSDVSKVPGNPWIICTLWVAKYHIRKAKTIDELKAADVYIRWACKHADSTGVMAEQINPYSGSHLSVSPLTWSHAEFIDVITLYSNKYKELIDS